MELTSAEAELAFLKWEKGYNQRQAQRQAQAQAQAESAISFYDEINEVMQKYPQFDQDSPEYDAELNKEFMEEMNEEFIHDRNGVIVGSRVSPMKRATRIMGYLNRVQPSAQTPLRANRVSSVQPRGGNSRTVTGKTGTSEEQMVQNMYKKLGIDPSKI